MNIKLGTVPIMLPLPPMCAPYVIDKRNPFKIFNDSGVLNISAFVSVTPFRLKVVSRLSIV